jgi:hypothetical protein
VMSAAAASVVLMMLRAFIWLLFLLSLRWVCECGVWSLLLSLRRSLLLSLRLCASSESGNFGRLPPGKIN